MKLRFMENVPSNSSEDVERFQNVFTIYGRDLRDCHGMLRSVEESSRNI